MPVWHDGWRLGGLIMLAKGRSVRVGLLGSGVSISKREGAGIGKSGAPRVVPVEHLRQPTDVVGGEERAVVAGRGGGRPFRPSGRGPKFRSSV